MGSLQSGDCLFIGLTGGIVPERADIYRTADSAAIDLTDGDRLSVYFLKLTEISENNLNKKIKKKYFKKISKMC